MQLVISKYDVILISTFYAIAEVELVTSGAILSPTV